jgi:predicted membrane protein
MLKSTEKILIKKMFLYPVLIVGISFLLKTILSYFTLYTLKNKEINKNIKILLNNKKNYIRENVINLSHDIDNALKFSIDETKKM